MEGCVTDLICLFLLPLSSSTVYGIPGCLQTPVIRSLGLLITCSLSTYKRLHGMESLALFCLGVVGMVIVICHMTLHCVSGVGMVYVMSYAT